MGDDEKKKEEAINSLFNWTTPVPASTVIRELKAAPKEEKSVKAAPKKKTKKGRNYRHRKSLTHAQKENIARGVIAGRFLPNADSDNRDTSVRISEAAECFAKLHATYYAKRIVDWRKRLEDNPGVMGCLSKAVAAAEWIGCTVEDFLKSQFWWFDMAFKRTPTYQEIAGPKSRVRYQEWLRVKQYGGVALNIRYPAIRGVQDVGDTTAEEILDYELSVLAKMVKQWGGEAKVWEMFGDVDDDEVFSLGFKNSRATWRNMYLRWIRMELEFAIFCGRGGEMISGPYCETVTGQCLTSEGWARWYVSNLEIPSDTVYQRSQRPVFALISVSVISENSLSPHHNWRAPDSPIPGRKKFRPLWEKVTCSRCGATGRRSQGDTQVYRDREFSAELYDDCGDAVIALKRKP